MRRRIVARANEYIKRRTTAGKPFFVWFNTTHMHRRTHAEPESRARPGTGSRPVSDSMVDHDRNVGQVLEVLDEPASPTTPSSCTRPTTART